MFFDNQQLPALLTFAEAMEYLFISKNTLLKMLHNRTIKGFKVGKQWRIKKEDLIEFSNSPNEYNGLIN